jgi:hypothetical protein
VFGVLALIGVQLPDNIDEAATLNLVMVVLTVLGTIFAGRAKSAIG